MNYQDMSLEALVRHIKADWKKVNYAALSYLNAMGQMTNVHGTYLHDNDVVLRFLGNASTWRGPVAKAIKAELRRRLENR